ncbi:MAG: restriction endonuclease subunit S [Thaumarchaeota archaeon]|nr:restriction endonuclease subunit S [Nitrososphaerota archaeon]
MKKKTKFKQTEVGMIPEDWDIKLVNNIAKIIGGGTPSTKVFKYWNGCIPWITPKSLSNFKFRYICRGERNITSEGLKNSSAKLIPANAVLLTTRAPVGYLAIAKNPLTTNQGFRSLVPNENICTDFLFYLLKNNICVLKSNASGTVFEELSGTRLKSLVFAVPNIKEQKSIAKILSDLDFKIELNHKMNKTLEDIAQTIFKHWFIDYEFPDENGTPYRSSGGEVVYSEELGHEIPKGWQASTILKEFNLVMGQSPPGKSYNRNGDGMIFFQGRTDFGTRFPSVRMFCNEPTRLAKKGDTLVSVRAPVGDINMSLQDCCIGRGLAALRHKSDDSSYTYYFMKNLRQVFDGFEAEGTVFGSLSKTNFEKIVVSVPFDKTLNSFKKIVSVFDEKLENNTLEILGLGQIRDYLLPKLMSGKIRVPMET